MEGARTASETPLAALLREKVDRVLAGWDRVSLDLESPPEAIERFVAALSAIEKAVEKLDRGGPLEAQAEMPPLRELERPRSYAHLAGLMPRALERVMRFDVAAAAIRRRPGDEPVVDVLSRPGCDPALGEGARERVLALLRVLSGGIEAEGASLPPRPPALRSSLYVPLACGGQVVGATYVAALRGDAFSAADQRTLEQLALHASGAFQRLEGEVAGLRVTGRQAQVLSLIASGLSDKEIAARLGVGLRTVRTHLERVLRENGLHSRTEALTAWLRGEPR